MTDIPAADATLNPGPFTAEQWSRSLQTLRELLETNNGIVSSILLARELRRRHGLEESRPLIVGLTYADPDDLRVRGLEVPQFEFHHRGRSFYTPSRYKEAVQEAEAETEREAEDAGRSVEEEPDEEIPLTRANRQEEARLTTYVKRALETIYESENVPEEAAPYVFDVHSERPGTAFENVDILAVAWRSRELVDLVTVEVKLDFIPQVVQQALYYKCFSNHVWIAVPVNSDISEAAMELRAKSPQLFEYVVQSGIGILACRRRQGRSYDVAPIHWPRRSDTDPLARELFAERYREFLEEASVLERRKRSLFPRLR